MSPFDSPGESPASEGDPPEPRLPAPVPEHAFLHGERLHLRAPHPNDLPRLLRWINDPEVRQYLGAHRPLGEVAEREWLEASSRGERGAVFAIVVGDENERASSASLARPAASPTPPPQPPGGREPVLLERGRHIGQVGLHDIESPHRRPGRSAILGIVIGEPALWGRGYGREAVRLLLGYAFNELNLHRVELDVLESNERAWRSYERVGFQREGVLREAMFRHGRYQDVIRMAILDREYRERYGNLDEHEADGSRKSRAAP